MRIYFSREKAVTSAKDIAREEYSNLFDGDDLNPEHEVQEDDVDDGAGYYAIPAMDFEERSWEISVKPLQVHDV